MSSFYLDKITKINNNSLNFLLKTQLEIITIHKDINLKLYKIEISSLLCIFINYKVLDNNHWISEIDISLKKALKIILLIKTLLKDQITIIIIYPTIKIYRMELVLIFLTMDKT